MVQDQTFRTKGRQVQKDTDRIISPTFERLPTRSKPPTVPTLPTLP
ncbi:MAG: hypothetical protein F6K40_04340 [Okeania sp. SIO3I5]|nr:hypothetical protein [Okeania sp. SIO3I5]NEQ35566.1 hypothetical protein [Okeania sp. SIO3I5]